jgi:hypothetical protein
MPYNGDATLESRCRDLVQSLDLPRPCTPTALVDVVADRLGEPVHLRPLTDDLEPQLSGAVIRTPVGYVVYYPQEEEQWWKLMCIAHELAHILCGHLHGTPNAVTASVINSRTGAGAPEAVRTASDLLPDLQEAIKVWGPLYRCNMAGPTEQEAEMVATLIVLRIETESSGNIHPIASFNRDDGVLDRFARILGPWRARYS